MFMDVNKNILPSQPNQSGNSTCGMEGKWKKAYLRFNVNLGTF